MAKRLIVLLAALTLSSLAAEPAPHVFFRVTAAPSLAGPLKGRLLIFVKQGTGDKEVDCEEFHPQQAWVAAREVQDLMPGASVQVDADEIAFPKPFSNLPAGDYEAQAVLDVNHTYPYSGRGPEDWITAVTSLPHWNPADGTEPRLTLDRHPPGNPQRTAHLEKLRDQAQPGITRREELVSKLLTRFWGRPTSIKAWVILPPGYSQNTGARYPTVYWTHGFGGSLDYSLVVGLPLHTRMKEGKMPPMIWVMLDESIPQGTHEFADSVNNGPWGAALTSEFIPYLERKYRMDARRNGRFLNGHSSGGWATLQLEVNYPTIFGGTWSTSPDPSDFHDFTGANLYAPHANVYRLPDGSPLPIIRDHGKVQVTFEQISRVEAVLGPYGGQISSFDWVFSPKAENGAPLPMFDRQTGDVDSAVIKYWHDHYDLAHLVEANWPQRGRDLKGRIHLFVGTADTFYLDGSAHKFEAVLQRLGANPHFTYIPDRTHFDLYSVGADHNGLFNQIAKEMYAVARPPVSSALQARSRGQ
jgi:enterochelin esterase-like enzyme